MFANTAAAELIGSDNAEQLMGLSVFRFVYREDIHSLRKLLERFRYGEGLVEPAATRLIRIDQAVIDVEVRALSAVFQNKPSVVINICGHAGTQAFGGNLVRERPSVPPSAETVSRADDRAQRGNYRIYQRCRPEAVWLARSSRRCGKIHI